MWLPFRLRPDFLRDAFSGFAPTFPKRELVANFLDIEEFLHKT
jgi:hypothetical protein